MKCVVLVMPNEEIQGEELLQKCGLDLEIIKHPVTPYNYHMNLNPSPIFTRPLCEFEASLLNSWIDMLRTYQDTDEYILFAESDILPIFKMNKEMILNSDTEKFDILRPFLYLDVDDINPLREMEDTVQWLDGFDFLNKTFRTHVKYPYNLFRYKCGTHALLASKQGIQKLINVFETINAPADVSLELGTLKKKISVGISTQNFFIQYDRPSWNSESKRDKFKSIFNKK